MAAILGVSPYANAYDVWLEKTGQIDYQKEADYLTAGTFFENGVLDWAELQLGKLERDADRLEVQAIGFPIVSHLDAQVIETGNPVEAKTAGLFGPLTEDYGENNTDALPDRVIVQCHVHMLAVDKRLCHVPVFIGGRGFVMYTVHWDNVIADTIMDKSIEFWDEYVVKKVPPPNIIPSGEFVKKIRRTPDKVIEISADLVTNWENAKESLQRMEAIAEGAKNELIAALGDAEAGVYSDDMMVTYFEQSKFLIDAKRLKKEKPEIAEEYKNISKSRVLRTKKIKKDDKFEIEKLNEKGN